MFKIGEKVVCAIPFEGLVLINGQWVSTGELLPVLNEIYTVNFVHHHKVMGVGIGLEEFSKNMVFPASHFRKLDHTFAEEVTARIEEEINQENLVGA